MTYKHLFIFCMTPLFCFASVEQDPCTKKKLLRQKMVVIASNLANINTTRTPDGGPYRWKEMICNADSCEIIEATRIKKKHEPDHPDADEKGYVSSPDYNPMEEMVSMIETHREYEAATKNCN